MKKVTCKEFFSNLLSGVWQALRWFVGLLGYKDESSFGQVVKRIFALCVTILLFLFTACMLYALATEWIYKEWIRPYTDDTVSEEVYLSNHIVFQRMYYSHEWRVYDMNREKVMLKGVDWVTTSDDNDSLAVFARNDRRGYLNRFTGEIVIPEDFTRAWVFSEGLAAVEKDGELLFIDHSGKVVIDKDFEVYNENPSYAFECGYCAIRNPVDGNVGLIDKAGNWVLEPEYEKLHNEEGFWLAEKGGHVGLYTADVELLFPIENTGIRVYNGIIEVRHADHIARRYDCEGNMLVDFVVDEVANMEYETTRLRNDLTVSEDECVDRKVYSVANCQRYLVRNGDWQSPDYYGLLNRNGTIVTPPIYTQIEAIAEDLYLCQPDGVIVNDYGEVVN